MIHDVRHALRALARRPAFALAVVTTLALGIGGTSAVFSVVNAALLRPLPFADGERLLRVRAGSLSPEGEARLYSMSDVEFLALRAEEALFERVLAARPGSGTLTGDGPAERVSEIGVSPGYWPGLGVSPFLGRHFSAEEERLGPDSGVALIGYGLWQRRYGGSPGILGRALRLGDRTLEVVGVMPPGLAYPYGAELWTPARFDPGAAQRHVLNVVVLPREGASPALLESRLADLARRLEEAHPESNRGTFIATEPVRTDLLGDREGPALLLMGAVAFLLLIGCADVAGLMLTRAVGRHRELALRAALGAGRGRQVRELLAESAVLAAAGGGAGLLVARLSLDSLVQLLPPSLADVGLGRPGLDLRVLGVALLVTSGTALLVGVFPALLASRVDLRGVLQAGGRGVATPGQRLLRGLAGAQMALALVLLFGTFQTLESFRRLSRAEPGFEIGNLVTAKIALGESLAGEEERRTFVADLSRELQAIPGVRAAGLTTVNPLCCGDWGAVVSVEGLVRPEDAPPLVVHHRLVTPELFPALGVTLLRGRLFDPADTAGAEPVAVVDARLAERFWPGGDPIGKRLKRGRLDSEHPWLTVVGVVSAVLDAGDYTETWYLPYAQNPRAPSSDLLHPMLRTGLPAGRLAPELRAALARVHPDLAVYDTLGMEDVRAREIAEERLGALLVAVFGGFGLVLAALGLYGSVALGAQRRRGEIGVRLALGADGPGVVGLVLRDGLRVASAGTAVGVPACFAVARALRALGGGLAELSLVPAASALLVLAATALLACWIPARRAAAVDPLVVLRDA